MNCCRHKYFVIYRGDDTDFPGNQELIIELNTERDLTGCEAHFSFQGFTQDFTEIPADKKLHLIIPSSATSNFALGVADAKLWLTNGTKVRTVENRIHIVVTNRVDEAYDNDDPQAITVTISGGGGGATVVLDDTVTEESTNGVKSSGIWSWVKSLLPSWLTAESEEPRGKTELRVFEAPYSTWVIEGEHLPDNLTIGRYADYHPEYPVDGFAPVIDGNTVGLVKGNSESVNLSWDDNEWSGGVPLSATRTKLPIVPVSPPQKLTRTANLTAGGIAKFGADGVLEKASASSTGGGESADYRDPKDNKCHKTELTEWTLTYSDGVDHHFDASKISYYEGNWHFDGYNAYGDQYRDENATEISTSASFYEYNGYKITATRSTVATKDKPFVTADIAARSLECGEGDAKQTVSVENGVAKLDDFFTNSNSLLTGTIESKVNSMFDNGDTTNYPRS